MPKQITFYLLPIPVYTKSSWPCPTNDRRQPVTSFIFLVGRLYFLLGMGDSLPSLSSYINAKIALEKRLQLETDVFNWQINL